MYLDTFVAMMAKVVVSKSTGRVEVKRVVCAQDQGVIFNMGTVLASAIYDAVGARLFQLPMTPARLRVALKRA